MSHSGRRRGPGGSGGEKRKPPSGLSKQAAVGGEMEKIAQDVRDKMVMTPKPTQFALRPVQEYREGIPVDLFTNHYKLIFKNDKLLIIQYRIDIEEKKTREVTKKEEEMTKEMKAAAKSEEEEKGEAKKTKRKIAAKINRLVFSAMVEIYNNNKNQVVLNPFYDGQNIMFTFRYIPECEKGATLSIDVVIDDNGRNRAYKVDIKKADAPPITSFNLDPKCEETDRKRAIQAIDIILRHVPTMTKIPIGSSFFDPADQSRRVNLIYASQLAFGHYQSARNLMAGTTINVNKSCTVFYKEMELPNFIGSIIGVSPLQNLKQMTDLHKRKIKKELVGLQIEAMHIQFGGHYRKYRVLGLSERSARDETFEWKEMNRQTGKEENMGKISVVDYFQRKYNKRLVLGHLPCITVGNPKNKVTLPIEVCKLMPNQRIRRQLTNEEKSIMVKETSQKPFQRFQQCLEYVREINTINRPFLYDFGISIEERPLQVKGQVIKAPTLQYNGKTVTPRNGSWDMRGGERFYSAARLENWVLIDMSDRISEQEASCLVNELIAQAGEMGMLIRPVTKKIKVNKYEPGRNTIKNIMNRVKREIGAMQMIMFITPEKRFQFSDDLYSEIKRVGDTEAGIATQCLNAANVTNKKLNRSFLKNLLLKINPKLGGKNVIINANMMKKKNMMLVGADVHHPAPGDKISPSIAAVVASTDADYSSYTAMISLQERQRNEMITNIDRMFETLLQRYRAINNKLPDQILVYRDGVSEGQFQHVLDNEVVKLKEAFIKFPNYHPKLTFVIVQKRHHTRFMKTTVKKDDKFQNIDAGTVIDNGVVHHKEFDYFLCSHAGPLGTSRPAHYYVLLDENSWTRGDLYNFTYYMCHVYARSMKSVSMPAPAFYAHLCAYRAKVHLSGLIDETSTVASSGERAEDEAQLRVKEGLTKVNQALENKLYFC